MPVWECRVGHRYSPEGLVDAQAVSVESALWVAIRALEDRRRMLERVAEQCDARGSIRSARSFRHRAQAAREQARAIRDTLTRAAEVSLSKTEQDDADTITAQGGSR
jgi:two-component system chemotaxis response regulator CheB